MNDPRDIIEFRGIVVSAADADGKPGSPRKFLSIWYRCCHTYGRLYRNNEGTRYVGRCPKCGASIYASIGPGGTSRRTFKTQ